MEFISRLLEARKIPTRFIFTFFIVSSTILILPDSSLKQFYLIKIMQDFGHFVSIASLSTGTLLLTEFFLFLWSTIANKISTKKLRKAALERISKLDPAEKAVLREFFLQGQSTIKLPIDHPVVAGLLNTGILRRIANQGRWSIAGMLFNLRISDFVINYITPELIDLP